MSLRIVRARVHRGRLEPLEDLALPEGTEITMTIDIPDRGAKSPTTALTFDTYDLGATVPVSRQDIYDDAG